MGFLSDYVDPKNLKGFLKEKADDFEDVIHQAVDDPKDVARRFGEGSYLVDAVGNASNLEKAALATMPIPGVGDVTGLAADASMFIRDPETRTPANFALSATGLLPLVPSAAMIIGARSQKANLKGLEKAKAMEADGHSQKAIYDATFEPSQGHTGWFKGKDGEWRAETDDRQSGIVQNAPTKKHTYGERYNLGEFFEHPNMYEHYPDMANIEIKPEMRGGGGYTPSTDSMRIGYMRGDNPDLFGGNDTTIHEATHAIQSREGFNRGSSIEGEAARSRMWNNARTEWYDFLSAIDEAPRKSSLLDKIDLSDEALSGRDPQEVIETIVDSLDIDDFTEEGAALTHRIEDSWMKLQDKMDAESPRARYYRSAGEREARLMEKRRGGSLADKQQRPIFESKSFLKDDAIVDTQPSRYSF